MVVTPNRPSLALILEFTLFSEVIGESSETAVLVRVGGLVGLAEGESNLSVLLIHSSRCFPSIAL